MNSGLVTLLINDVEKSLSWQTAVQLATQLFQQKSPNFLNIIEQLIAIRKTEKSLYPMAFQVCLAQKNYPRLRQFASYACEYFPDNALNHYALAIANRYLHYQEASFSHLKQALALQPSNIGWQRLLATMLKEQGNFTEALAAFSSIIINAPNDFESYWLRADLNTNLTETERDQLINLCQASKLSKTQSKTQSKQMIFAGFTLFRYFDAQNDYDNAFHYLSLANKIKRQSFNFDIQQELDEHHNIISTFPSQFLAQFPIATNKKQIEREREAQGKTHDVHKELGENCIFICGMPRSGTTLAEQIIANHSEVNAGDELYFLAQAANDVISQLFHKDLSKQPFPLWANSLDSQHWRAIGKKYLSLTAHLSQGKRLTDKMPLNYKAIGIIKMALPKAKIIYCQRSTNDLLWGCYKQMFGEGNLFSYDLKELAKMICAHQQVMSHWQSIFTDANDDEMKEGIFTLAYESLIDSQEETTRQLLNYLELDWQDSCLNYHENTRTLHTLSNVQTRKPLSKKYDKQWLNYQKFLTIA